MKSKNKKEEGEQEGHRTGAHKNKKGTEQVHKQEQGQGQGQRQGCCYKYASIAHVTSGNRQTRQKVTIQEQVNTRQ